MISKRVRSVGDAEMVGWHQRWTGIDIHCKLRCFASQPKRYCHNGIKVTIKLNEGRGNVRGVHNEMVGEIKSFDDKKFNESEEVRMLPNNVASVH
jgi:hypothetical protein